MDRPQPHASPLPRIAAHRGASAYAADNSLRAMDLAVQLGADGAEFDVHATVDGHFVVFHDATIPGLGHFAELRWESVQTHRLPDGSTIPSLEAVLAALPGLEAWVELKGLGQSHDAALLAVLRRATAPARIAVHAFDHRILARLHAADPTLAIGALQASYPTDPLAAARAVGASALWQQWELIDADLVAAAHHVGMIVVAWTVPTHAVRMLADLGVDVLCVNAPDAARAMLS